MINADMRNYDYYTIDNKDDYGQPQQSTEVKGSIRIAIFTASQGVTSDIRYKNVNYIGLTTDANINDTYVIQYGAEQLKVLYIQPKGRFKQVFLVNK